MRPRDALSMAFLTCLFEVRLHFPVSYRTGHEYDTLTRRFRKIGDEAEMVAGPYAIDRLIEDTFARCNV